MTNNKLEELPDEFSQLSALTSVMLEGNQLLSMPDVGKMSKLTELRLTDNRLEHLPDNIGQCASLTQLYADKNHLKDLPAELAQCDKLRALWLNDNCLETIPKELCSLKNIKLLGLTGNFLSSLPVEVNDMKSVQALWLSKNQGQPLPRLSEVSDPKGDDGARVLVCAHLPQTNEPLTGDADSVTIGTSAGSLLGVEGVTTGAPAATAAADDGGAEADFMRRMSKYEPAGGDAGAGAASAATAAGDADAGDGERRKSTVTMVLPEGHVEHASSAPKSPIVDKAGKHGHQRQGSGSTNGAKPGAAAGTADDAAAGAGAGGDSLAVPRSSFVMMSDLLDEEETVNRYEISPVKRRASLSKRKEGAPESVRALFDEAGGPKEAPSGGSGDGNGSGKGDAGATAAAAGDAAESKASKGTAAAADDDDGEVEGFAEDIAILPAAPPAAAASEVSASAAHEADARAFHAFRAAANTNGVAGDGGVGDGDDDDDEVAKAMVSRKTSGVTALLDNAAEGDAADERPDTPDGQRTAL